MTAELRHLRALVAAADHGTLTAAASALQVSQPTLTRTLQQFEGVLGQRLLERGAHGVLVTAEGRRIVDLARDILLRVDDLTRGPDHGRALRLGFAWLLPPNWFRDFRDTARRCGVTVVPVRVDDPVAALTTSGGQDPARVDLALFRNTHRATPPGVVSRVIGTERRCAALPADSDLARAHLSGGTVTWHDLAAEPLVTNPNSGTTWAGSWPDGPADRVVVECANFEEWIELVAAGAGVGAVPELARERSPHPGVVYARLPDVPDSELALAWRTDSTSLALQDLLHSGALT